MIRRTFLRTLSLAGLGALLPARRGLGRSPDSTPRVRWAELVEYARWAPSPHNIQPWAVRPVSATEAELWVEPDRLLRATDPASRFTVAGLGIFCECLRQAAAPLDLGLEVEHQPAPRLDYTATERQLFARLWLTTGADPPALDRELIRQRRTSRLHYDGRAVAAGVQQRLATIAAHHGHVLHFSDDPEVVDFVLDLNRETLFTDLDHEADRTELAGWIRTTDAEAEKRRDGLWNRCMGFRGKLMHNFFYHHERFRVHWKRRLLGKVYKHSMHGTATVAWLTGPYGNRAEWFAAGTMMQRLWLEMTRAGVYLHPYGSVVTNAAAHQRFVERVGHDESQQGELWLLVRMGYSKEPWRSLRRTTDEILIS